MHLTNLCEMPSDIEVELEVPPEPLQCVCVRSDAHDTGALYVHTILTQSAPLVINTTDYAFVVDSRNDPRHTRLFTLVNLYFIV